MTASSWLAAKHTEWEWADDARVEGLRPALGLYYY